MYDSGWSGHSFFGMGLGGGLFMIVFWIVLLVAIVMLLRWALGTRDTKDSSTSEQRALHILEERYARGEIDEDEYLEKRRHLE